MAGLEGGQGGVWGRLDPGQAHTTPSGAIKLALPCILELPIFLIKPFYATFVRAVAIANYRTSSMTYAGWCRVRFYATFTAGRKG